MQPVLWRQKNQLKWNTDMFSHRKDCDIGGIRIMDDVIYDVIFSLLSIKSAKKKVYFKKSIAVTSPYCIYSY